MRKSCPLAAIGFPGCEPSSSSPVSVRTSSFFSHLNSCLFFAKSRHSHCLRAFASWTGSCFQRTSLGRRCSLRLIAYQRRLSLKVTELPLPLGFLLPRCSEPAAGGQPSWWQVSFRSLTAKAAAPTAAAGVPARTDGQPRPDEDKKQTRILLEPRLAWQPFYKGGAEIENRFRCDQTHLGHHKSTM